MKWLECLQALDLHATSTGFQKREQQKITYLSGGNKSQIDYTMVRRRDRRHMKDNKTFPGEAVVKQCRLLVTDFEVKKENIGKKKRTTGKIKTWALDHKETREEFAQKVEERSKVTSNGSMEEEWKKMKQVLQTAAKEVCGTTKGGKKKDET